MFSWLTNRFTDEFTNSIFCWYVNNSPTKLPTNINRRYHRGNNNPSVLLKRKFFFWRANSVCKTVGKWFFCFANWYSDGMGNHRRKVSRRTYSVGNLVGKYFTDVLLITDRRNMSVSKTVNSCCVLNWKCNGFDELGTYHASHIINNM